MRRFNYSKKLKDPRWQRVRLRIFERDNFTCQMCDSTENSLCVHHIKYSGEPWEAPDEYLITLCEFCHEVEHNNREVVDRNLLDSFRLKKLNSEHISWMDCVLEHTTLSADEITLLFVALFSNNPNIDKILDDSLRHVGYYFTGADTKAPFVRRVTEKYKITIKDTL